MPKDLEQIKLFPKHCYSSLDEFSNIINSISSKNNFELIDRLDSVIVKRMYSSLFDKRWCSFVSFPYRLPDWQIKSSPNLFDEFLTKEWKYCAKFCLGLFTFTETLKDDLSELSKITVTKLIHPLPLSEKKWSPEKFEEFSQKKIIQPGHELRCLNAIFMLPKSKFKKILLTTCKQHEIDLLLSDEQNNLGLEFRKPMLKTAKIIIDTENNIESWYDDSIFFLHLYDSSHDWVVLKCIADHVPLLINRLPSMIEYLGVDYPLYYSCYDEAIEKALDTKLIIYAHEYLKKRSEETFFSLNWFENKFCDLISTNKVQL